MANFDFKLERVLNYKKTVENFKKNKYGMMRQRLIKEEDKLSNFNDHKKTIIEEKNMSNIKIKAGDLAMYNSYINDLNIQIKKQEEIVIETKENLERAKDEMIVSIKEKKIFEKLKENKYEEYICELKKQEEKQNDTLLSYRISNQQ
ncbi:flagellar export protein FliJ [Schnuerera sp. xch1]|uniref:flagellar export protein FliJ n=1 Tax=Schnuerera sp. xch1 TaxID=2874283 RepID=UPI001CBD4A64|nr:flagellar export protein FliJ [Schnuerera sp. xch1]MBZ2173875.1 flagellar export protein FliJ [Schnuerera sp. xch1]